MDEAPVFAYDRRHIAQTDMGGRPVLGHFHMTDQIQGATDSIGRISKRSPNDACVRVRASGAGMTLPGPEPTALSPRGLRYHVLILCIWQEPDSAHPSWRFSLEGLQAADRRGFRSLEALVDHIRALMAAPVDS